VAKRVRNQFGVISEVPDDYPEDLMRQLELEEIREDDGTKEAGSQPQREGRRSRG